MSIVQGQKNSSIWRAPPGCARCRSSEWHCGCLKVFTLVAQHEPPRNHTNPSKTGRGHYWPNDCYRPGVPHGPFSVLKRLPRTLRPHMLAQLAGLICFRERLVVARNSCRVKRRGGRSHAKARRQESAGESYSRMQRLICGHRRMHLVAVHDVKPDGMSHRK